MSYGLNSPEHHAWERHREQVDVQQAMVNATRAAVAAAERSREDAQTSERHSRRIAWLSLGVAGLAAAATAVSAVVAIVALS